MKVLGLIVAALGVLGSTWAKNGSGDNPIEHKNAPWLDMPRPKIAKDGQFPWQVAIIVGDSLFCTGSLISAKWVLTAAHCAPEGQSFELVIGSDQKIRQTVSTAIRHPQFEPDTGENDLALLELPTPVVFTRTVLRIALPVFLMNKHDFEGEDLLFTGWASLNDKLSMWADVSTPPLRWALVRGASDDVCNAFYGTDLMSPNKICLATTRSPHEEGFLSLAEGGAPIVLDHPTRGHIQIALLSFGPDASVHRPPVVAVRVAPYLKFIESVTGIPGSFTDP